MKTAKGAWSWDSGFDAADAFRACAAHLADLERAHPDGPPPDVAVPPTKIPKRLAGAFAAFTSPAQLCAAEGEGA